jgi:hypothetical protein
LAAKGGTRVQCTQRAIAPTDSRTNLVNLDNSNGVEVGLLIGDAAAVQTIKLKQMFPNMLVYNGIGCIDDPGINWDR